MPVVAANSEALHKSIPLAAAHSEHLMPRVAAHSAYRA